MTIEKTIQRQEVLERLNPEGFSLINELFERGEGEAAATLMTFSEDRRIAKEYIENIERWQLPVLNYKEMTVDEDGVFIPWKIEYVTN